jgi:membrane-bound lytic murein transglycosylase D
LKNVLLCSGCATLAILLTACSTVPSSNVPRGPAVTIAPKVAVASSLQPTIPDHAATMPVVDMWDQLRGSFAMADCDADPSVLDWAHRYTRNASEFESRMQGILPRLAYVQQVAADYDIAGEFVLLPWVESGFQNVPGRRKRPAGMWQIMPVTAGSMGLHVDGHYDARLDTAASATAVMKLLKMYHDQFHDWRIVDYAYNGGEFKIRQLMQTRSLPPALPVIPKWPVQRVTREHLTKLLAIACVVRDPSRFNVSLPTLSPDDQLVRVSVSHSMPIAQAANHAGMSVDIMKGLNAAFRADMIDVGASPYLMLPASHVGQFQSALQGAPKITDAASATPALAGSTRTAAAGRSNPSHPKHPTRKTYRVKPGESLWRIAQRYSINVDQLQRWNHLHGGALKPGQILLLSDDED